MPEAERLRYVWGILNECVEKSGGYSNLDFGGAGRFRISSSCTMPSRA